MQLCRDPAQMEICNRGEECLMKQSILKFLSAPPEIRPELRQDAFLKNRRSLFLICIMIFFMELFNIARVLFWSRSGLDSVNNRIYFGLYCALLFSAALYLLLDRLLRQRSARLQQAVQYGSVFFFFLWHALLNSYDLMRDPFGGTGVFAVLALAVFIHMPAAFSITAYVLTYVLFLLLSHSNMTSGDIINLTFSTIVALAVSLTDMHNLSTIISQRQALENANAQLQAMSQKDPLTGLLNKTAFQSHTELAIRNAGSSDAFALLLIDLDNFKRINDLFGHLCGDYVIEQTAEALQSAFPDAAGIGRVGGDEFAVALYGPAAARPEAASRQLIQSLVSLQWRDEPVHACCSIGICRTAHPDVAYRKLYELADHALYQAKRLGKGRYYIFTPD